MRDVSRLAEVSVATVSAVVNGTTVVSQKRTERVTKAMQALDYHADQIARSLKTGRTRTVGMILPDVTNPYYPEIITGAEEVARAARHSVILCNANEDLCQEQQQLSTLFSHRVDGVLIACSDPAISFDRLMRRRFPIVCFDRIPLGFRGDTVSTDNFLGAYEATNHLIELGHKRIALVMGRPDLSTHAGRMAGYRKAMLAARLPMLDEYAGSGEMQAQAGYAFGRRLLELRDPPTAVFCTNNKMLLGFMKAMRDARTRCPEDVSVVGFDDFAWTENFQPRLTTVAQPARELGRRAMQLLLERIEGKHDGGPGLPENVVLKPELRIRESTRRLESKAARRA